MMKPAVDVVYRDLDSSASLNEAITKKIEKLNRYSDQILHSRVVLDTPHNHKHKGKQFRASIEIDIKGQPIAVTQDNESIHVAVRDAFNTAERKIKQFTSRQRIDH
jgi:ribosomal subunit interface protein